MLSGCDADVPQNTFDAKGEVARDQRDLFYYAMWPAIVVMLGVFLAIFVLVLRFRERDPNSRPPKQMHGNTKLEIAWTIAPILPLLILGGIMVPMISDMGNTPADAYQINVEGQRFSFFFSYPDIKDSDGNPISVPGTEAHIPMGQKVAFHLTSIDVIHSFWLPKLGGKLDMVPGQTNTLWLQADEPGTIRGQCVELCGTGHGDMFLSVQVDTPEDFQKWADEQSAPPPTKAPTPAPSGGASGTPAASGSPTPTAAATTAAASPTPTAVATPTPTGS